MRTLVQNFKVRLCGISPVNCVCDDSSYVGIIEGSAGFVTGLEIENSSKLTGEAAARTEDLAALVGGDENNLVGVGDAEGLAIGFLVL